MMTTKTTVIDYQTGETLRAATATDLEAARGTRGAEGVFGCPATGDAVYLDGVPHDGTRYDLSGVEVESDLSVAVVSDTRVVRDANGGVWWPSDEASEAIEGAADPEAEALRICREEPMRGVWAS